MKHITTKEQFDSLLADKKNFIIFKHSTTCSISWWACREVYQSIDALWIQEIYLLDVLQYTELKMYVADKTHITHESPQVIIFHHGQVVADASHWSITKAWIQSSLERYPL